MTKIITSGQNVRPFPLLSVMYIIFPFSKSSLSLSVDILVKSIIFLSEETSSYHRGIYICKFLCNLKNWWWYWYDKPFLNNMYPLAWNISRTLYREFPCMSLQNYLYGSPLGGALLPGGGWLVVGIIGWECGRLVICTACFWLALLFFIFLVYKL